MSDKRIKELLILWDDLVHCFLPIGMDAMLKEKLIEIRRRIEHGPKVSRAFVERWAKKIDRDYGDFTTRADPTRDNLMDMLYEIPVTVKEEKK